MKLGFQLEDSWWVGVLCTIKVLLMFLTLEMTQVVTIDIIKLLKLASGK